MANNWTIFGKYHKTKFQMAARFFPNRDLLEVHFQKFIK